MKKLSIILNVVLFVLVGILFYLHFSNQKTHAAPAQTAQQDGPQRQPLRISYVNIDSLEAHYGYFQQKKAELDKKQQSIQKELAAKANAIQKDIADLQKKAPTLTQSEGMAAQKKIVAQRESLQKREQELRTDFMQQQQAFNQELHERLQRFLEQYNQDKHYTLILSYSESLSDILYKDKAYDITSEVIRGLNAELPAKP